MAISLSFTVTLAASTIGSPNTSISQRDRYSPFGTSRMASRMAVSERRRISSPKPSRSRPVSSRKVFSRSAIRCAAETCAQTSPMVCAGTRTLRSMMSTMDCSMRPSRIR